MTDDCPPTGGPLDVSSTSWIGQELDWEADLVPAELIVELPFWLMVPDTGLEVEVSGYSFRVDIREGYFELHAGVVLESEASLLYIGPGGSEQLPPDVIDDLAKRGVPIAVRPRKTALVIQSWINSDVLERAGDGGLGRPGGAIPYLQSFSSAHIAVVNHVVQSYRLATYDYFAYEVSPMDVPIWIVKHDSGITRVVLLPYAAWDEKPLLGVYGDPEAGTTTYELIDPVALRASVYAAAGPGEFELLDALSLMERGDYSGAVRRVATAIEVLVEAVLRVEYQNLSYTDQRVRDALYKVREVDRRIQQIQRLTGQDVGWLLDEWRTTRELRRSIVHDGRRVTYTDRGEAQRSVDTGRMLYELLENRPDRAAACMKNMGLRSLGRHALMLQYDSEITSAGVVVHKPGESWDEQVTET